MYFWPLYLGVSLNKIIRQWLIKQYLKEGLWDNFKDWVSDTAQSTVKGVSDFFVDSWEGIKEFGVAISKGDWNEIVNLLGRGVKLKNGKSKVKESISLTEDEMIDLIEKIVKEQKTFGI